MSSGQKAAAERDEDDFWRSMEGRYLIGRIAKNNKLLPEWNALIAKIDSVKMCALTVGEYQFLLTCKKLDETSTAWYAHKDECFVDLGKLEHLKELLK